MGQHIVPRDAGSELPGENKAPDPLLDKVSNETFRSDNGVDHMLGAVRQRLHAFRADRKRRQLRESLLRMNKAHLENHMRAHMRRFARCAKLKLHRMMGSWALTDSDWASCRSMHRPATGRPCRCRQLRPCCDDRSGRPWRLAAGGPQRRTGKADLSLVS